MISLFRKSRMAALADGEKVEVLGVTKGDTGVALWVVRKVLADGESVMRCHEHLRFDEDA